ncbi:MAG: hypothetical protein ACLUI3_09435 [Christensenellales bacterium]
MKSETLETLSVEDYLPAVLAGEMAEIGRWKRSRRRRFGAHVRAAIRLPKRNPCTTARYLHGHQGGAGV